MELAITCVKENTKTESKGKREISIITEACYIHTLKIFTIFLHVHWHLQLTTLT